MTRTRTYGTVLRELRKYYGYSQKEIAMSLNITPQAYSNYEKNRRTPPIDVLLKLADIYEMPVTNLIYWEDHSNAAGEITGETRYQIFEPDKNQEIPVSGSELKMLLTLRKLPKEKQEEVYRYIRFLKEEQEDGPFGAR